MKNCFSLTNLNLLKSFILSTFFKYPMFCRFELTSKCNFRCEFCHIHRNNTEEDLSTEQVLQIIDSLSESGTSFLYFTGGEPLLREDIHVILKYAKQKNMYVILGTNGSLFKKKFKDISKYIDNVHFSLQSVNKFNTVTGTGNEQIFHDIIDGIKLAKTLNIPVQINVTIYKNTLSEMIKIAKFINGNLSVNMVFSDMKLLSPNPKDNEEMKCLLPDIEKFKSNLSFVQKKIKNISIVNAKIKKEKTTNANFCKAGDNIVVVTSSGELLLPCEFLILRKEKITTKNDIKTFFNLYNKVLIDKRNYEVCKNCFDTCYLQPSFFLTFKGFFVTLKNMLFSK